MQKETIEISFVMVSNMYTLRATGSTPPNGYTQPTLRTARLRARLILEEAQETINALGFAIVANDHGVCGVATLPEFASFADADTLPVNLVDIIDGCCDLTYVAIGTLASVGAPDVPHLRLVCEANDAKFPNGNAILRQDGKYLKPDGWTPPPHEGHIQCLEPMLGYVTMALQVDK